MSFLNELIDCPLNLLEIEKKFGLWGYGFIEYSKWNKGQFLFISSKNNRNSEVF